jgi:isopenicillin-N epimerase
MERAPVLWFPELPGRLAATRADLAGFLCVGPGDLALVPNVSAGASVVYGALERRHGGEIVVTDHGYGAVTMGAERLARRWGGRVRTARVPHGADENEAYEAVVAEVGKATDLVVSGWCGPLPGPAPGAARPRAGRQGLQLPGHPHLAATARHRPHHP